MRDLTDKTKHLSYVKSYQGKGRVGYTQ